MIIDRLKQYYKLSIQDLEAINEEISRVANELHELGYNSHDLDADTKRERQEELEEELERLQDKITDNESEAVNAYLDSLPGSTFEERDEVIYQDYCATLDSATAKDYKRSNDDVNKVYNLLTKLKPTEDNRAFAEAFCLNIALSRIVDPLQDALELNYYRFNVYDGDGNVISKTQETLEQVKARYEAKYEERKAQLLEELITPRKQSTLKTKAKAEELGAIMKIERLSFPSSELYRDAFNPRCIFRLHDGEDDQCDDQGQLQIFGDSKPVFDTLDEVHLAFLGLLLSINNEVKFDDDTRKFTIYAPKFCRELNVDPRAKSTERDASTSLADDQTNYLVNLAKMFDRLFGKIGNAYYRVLSIDTIDYDNYLITLNAPYIYQVKTLADKLYLSDKKPPYNKLIHSDVMNRDQTSLALASRILNGILQRGNTVIKSTGASTDTEDELEGQMEIGDFIPGAKRRSKRVDPVVYTVKWQTLIDDVPQLKQKLETTLKSSSKTKYQDYNVILQRAFSQAFDIIENHSDAPTTWLNFTIPKHKAKLRGGKTVTRYNLPTRTTTQTKLKITHNGKAKTDS